MKDNKDIFSESLELLRDMSTERDTGEIEDYMVEAERGGITKRVKYEMIDTRIKFSYLGKIFYIELDSLLAGRKAIFSFINTLLQRLNPAIYPARFIKTGKDQAIKPEEEPKAEEPKVEKEIEPEEEPKEEKPKKKEEK